MGVQLTQVCIDAVNVDRVAGFWAEALGWRRFTDEDGDVVLADPSGEAGLEILVLQVPEPKVVKNRLHLDVRPRGTVQADELERLLGLGATPVDVGQGETPWVVLADPEGNEFCLLRRPADAGQSDPAR
jgi:hypothetical protein